MRWIWFVSFMMIGSAVAAQSTNISTFFHKNAKKADHYFDDFAYRNALELYLHQFEKDSGDYHIRERIAMCYEKLQDPESAEKWYETLARERDINSAVKLAYAEILSMNGKYDEAVLWFQIYLGKNPEDKMAAEKLSFLKSRSKYLDDDHRYLIVATAFNTPYSEYGAHFFHDGVVFASSRDTDHLIKYRPGDALSDNESMLNMFYAGRAITGDWEPFVPFHPGKVRTNYHEGPMAFYDNYRKGAFTQSHIHNGSGVADEDGKVNLRIYFAEIAHLNDFETVAPFEYNNEAYSNAHPAFSTDGRIMYFSSTMPGGNGGSDIYRSEYLNGAWQRPENVGEEVNTRKDESFPFIANDTALFFSSNGHGSFGGLDIYVSYLQNGKFGKPANLGYPINTRFDDFSLACDSIGRTGFFASNREGGKGNDDIYNYVANFYMLAGKVRELSAEQKELHGVKILAYNLNGELVDSVMSDADGNYMLDLPYDQDFIISGEKDGFEALEGLEFSTRGKPFGIDSLMLPLWKQNLFAKGRLFSNETQAILKDVTVTLHNITDSTSEQLMVDDSSGYNFLVRPGKRYRIEASKKGFLTNGFDLDTEGLREGELLNDIVLEEIYIEKELILFPYNGSDITPESSAQLDRIIRTLKKFTRATLNISAHADARGSREYNDQLSKLRALATRQYLVSRGINPNRIQVSWFGEELVLNRCSDGVECVEEEHSSNRRAEVKVQKAAIGR